MTKKTDIYTIDGLLQILGDNIDSINQDVSNENIRKSNAILQNIIAIKGIYSLAYDQRRLANISHIQDDFQSYLSPKVLGGSVLGDDSGRLAKEHEKDQKRKQETYKSVMYRLETEIADNKNQPNADDEHFLAQEFSDDEIDALNAVLARANSRTNLKTRCDQDVYLLKHLKPTDFGVETGGGA